MVGCKAGGSHLSTNKVTVQCQSHIASSIIAFNNPKPQASYKVASYHRIMLSFDAK